MQTSNLAFTAALAPNPAAFDDLAAALGDQRPQASEEALVQLGRALMTELLDVIADTALEDFQTLLGEALIGAFHSAAGRIEREADRARDVMRRLDRDFDGSEAADVELQEATLKARAGDAATQAAERIRDAASDAWTVSTGEVWTAWRGTRRGSFLTAAQLEAKQAIRAVRDRRAGDAAHRGAVVAFRGAPSADAQEDAARIFDALNWALAEWPDMALATTGAKGAEKLAIRWAQQKGVTLRDAWSALRRGRLKTLEALGLAERSGKGFVLDAQMEQKLRRLGGHQDIIRSLNERRLETGTTVRILQGRRHGRVMKTGRHDEIGTSPWAIVRDDKGQEFYAPLMPGGEMPKIGQDVVMERTAGGAARLLQARSAGASLE